MDRPGNLGPSTRPRLGRIGGPHVCVCPYQSLTHLPTLHAAQHSTAQHSTVSGGNDVNGSPMRIRGLFKSGMHVLTVSRVTEDVCRRHACVGFNPGGTCKSGRSQTIAQRWNRIESINATIEKSICYVMCVQLCIRACLSACLHASCIYIHASTTTTTYATAEHGRPKIQARG